MLNSEAAGSVRLIGNAGKTYSIQSVDEFPGNGSPVNWTSITNITLAEPQQLFEDSTIGAKTKRFYRAVLQP